MVAGVGLYVDTTTLYSSFFSVAFLARDVIYTCYDVSVRLSVCDGSELAHYS